MRWIASLLLSKQSYIYIYIYIYIYANIATQFIPSTMHLKSQQ